MKFDNLPSVKLLDIPKIKTEICGDCWESEDECRCEASISEKGTNTFYSVKNAAEKSAPITELPTSTKKMFLDIDPPILCTGRPPLRHCCKRKLSFPSAEKMRKTNDSTIDLTAI